MPRLSESYPSPPKTRPPSLAAALVAFSSPKEIRDSLLGDLQEEHEVRAMKNSSDADRWYWSQALKNIVHFTSKVFSSTQFLKFFVLLFTLAVFPTLIILISWLSNMEEASSEVWETLLQGKVHALLFSSEVLFYGTEKLVEEIELDMYVNIPGLLWTLFTFLVLFLMNRKSHLSPHKLAGLGYTLTFCPYILGLIFIDMANPVPTQIGPILAFMVFAYLYSALPLGYWILQRIRLVEKSR